MVRNIREITSEIYTKSIFMIEQVRKFLWTRSLAKIDLLYFKGGGCVSTSFKFFINSSFQYWLVCDLYNPYVIHHPIYWLKTCFARLRDLRAKFPKYRRRRKYRDLDER